MMFQVFRQWIEDDWPVAKAQPTDVVCEDFDIAMLWAGMKNDEKPDDWQYFVREVNYFI